MCESVALAVLFVGLGSAGCRNATDDARAAAVATSEANEKIAAANRESERKVSEANASFLKLREDYRHKTTNNLVVLDRDVEGLAAQAKQATGKAKIDLEARLVRVRAGREAFVRHYAGLENATGVVWDSTRVSLDEEWVTLKELVDKG